MNVKYDGKSLFQLQAAYMLLKNKRNQVMEEYKAFWTKVEKYTGKKSFSSKHPSYTRWISEQNGIVDRANELTKQIDELWFYCARKFDFNLETNETLLKVSKKS